MDLGVVVMARNIAGNTALVTDMQTGVIYSTPEVCFARLVTALHVNITCLLLQKLPTILKCFVLYCKTLGVHVPLFCAKLTGTSTHYQDCISTRK